MSDNERGVWLSADAARKISAVLEYYPSQGGIENALEAYEALQHAEPMPEGVEVHRGHLILRTREHWYEVFYTVGGCQKPASFSASSPELARSAVDQLEGVKEDIWGAEDE